MLKVILGIFKPNFLRTDVLRFHTHFSQATLNSVADKVIIFSALAAPRMAPWTHLSRLSIKSIILGATQGHQKKATQTER